MLRNLGQFQQLIFHNVYEKNVEDKGNPRTGCVYVLAIHDLSQLLDGSVRRSGAELWQSWGSGWDDRRPGNPSYERLSSALDAVRNDTHALLQTLD